MRWNSKLLICCFSFALTYCGYLPSGGIVDNGNKPSDPNPEEHPGKPPGTGSADATGLVGLTVVPGYAVSIPTGTFTSDKVDNDTIRLTSQNEWLEFSPASEALAVCDVTPVTNAAAIVIYACSDTHTILQDGATIVAEVHHSARSVLIKDILSSFRKK